MARDLYATLDLNLLKTLMVLAQEKNMRRAAERLFVTQPAVSQALKRLRQHFDEELFTRTPTGLQPTAFTDQLLPRIEPLLDDLSTVLNDRDFFDPSELDHPLNITLSPLLATFLGGRLFRTVRAEAPMAQMTLTNWNERAREQLARDELTLGISTQLDDLPKQVMSRTLVNDEFMVYSRGDHPLVEKGQQLELSDLDGCELAIAIVRGWNEQRAVSEQVLRAHGYRARVGFRSDLPGLVAEAVRHSDMLYPASSFTDPRIVEGLHSFRVRLKDEYLTAPVCAYFNQRHRRNPMTLWLLDLVESLFAH